LATDIKFSILQIPVLHVPMPKNGQAHQFW